MEEAQAASEASASASRQKSCNACVRSKRGCDKVHPRCTRCKEKDTECVYAKRPYSEAFPGSGGLDADSVRLGLSALPPSPWSNLATQTSSPLCTDNTFSFPDMNPSHLNDLGTGDCGRTHPILEEYEALSALYAKETAPESWADMQLTYGDEGREGQQKAVEAVSRTNGMDTERMVHICNKFDPWQVYDPNSRLHFVVERIKGYPAVFAQESCTPWMHKELYREEMEPSIQSCFTISALYSTVSDSNRSSVFKVLKQGPTALKQAPDTHIPRERLARTQALFLYQIMRVFDGDITLRVQAEKDMPLLGAWVGDLCTIRENLEAPRMIEDGMQPRARAAPQSWQRWVFTESVRRTIILAYAFIGLWRLMCNEADIDPVRDWDRAHRWTMSKQLWEAPTSFDFFQVWKEKPQHVIEGFNLEGFLKTGSGADVDEFGRLLLVEFMGIDDTKQWFADTGCAF